MSATTWKLPPLREAPMQAEGMTAEEADEWIAEAKQEVAEGADPEELLYDMGLEPDWAIDLWP